MVHYFRGGRQGWQGMAVLGVAALALTGCQNAGQFNPFKPSSTSEETEQQDANETSVKLVERDVEAPDVFQATDMGLWDGRPSLGGVWVAHPDVKEPERVIIRNTSNSKFVIGALFRRERENPGPVFQVSSDAAAALDMLAGAPAQLNVTALRREETQVPDSAEASDTPATVDAPSDVEASALDPVAGAAAAIDTAPDAGEPDVSENAAAPDKVTRPATRPAAAPEPKPSASSLDKPFIQIGIFSVEQNANNTATAMRRNGMVPTVKKQTSQGKTFWRVIVGPATNKSERSTVLKKIKGVGFDDAYPVTN